MKKLFLAALMTVVAFSAQAEFEVGGKLVAAPLVVKADLDGEIKEYAITEVLNTVSVYDDSLKITNNGISSRCGDYLGQLAEDISVVVETKKGERVLATVKAAQGEDRVVSIYGLCQQGTNILDQVQIDVKTGADIEVK